MLGQRQIFITGSQRSPGAPGEALCWPVHLRGVAQTGLKGRTKSLSLNDIISPSFVPEARTTSEIFSLGFSKASLKWVFYYL